MSIRLRTCTAVLLGLSLLHGERAFGQQAGEPPPLGLTPGDALPTRVRSNNQKMAESIASQLRQSAQLKRYQIDISYHDRTAVLTGIVTDQSQKDEALRIVQGVVGVDRVVDRLEMIDGIKRVQGEAPREPAAGPGLPALPAPQQEPAAQSPNLPPAPPPRGPDLGGNAAPAEPTPIFSAPPPSQAELGTPRMPPYAWPTYAPYNNYSRVAYPSAYPYNSFPFIGPVYPFPKVPLGWRSVRLEWDDGFWWFSKTATRWDWWKLRYY